ncbi:sulfurtransferase [Frigoriflavimonas asaccharolytica]|uniref:Thiosulfate/3-mercaptopyruvate sulfurtransferase n=1 Tax=Frigoriflavimonas asaccharolytica TaxID=2735899 RepID=A0A8J8K4W1_9FLAO|nr:sulfurtransferase [Frigoriflavimonas asaccharolytica]NRS92175.1 thiosulfate/3-mercaptopyruvate sulfurtransferase [Frigoriflavimonas asaccharolytica]
MKIPPIISPEEFSKIQNQENILLINAGFSREDYKKSHLENAFYLDLNEDLAEIPADAKNGGRHPLPTIEHFITSLAKVGAEKDSHFIIYDDKGGANSAARLWWMLRSVGFHKVQVLNGGLQTAINFGLKTTTEIPKAKKVEDLHLNEYQFPTKNLEEIKTASINEDKIIIDVREKSRFDGEHEPIDLIAGHIPNAINIPFSENLDENGLFKSPEILKQQYTELLKGRKYEEIIVHCGSGVTACHTILAMDYAGFEIPNLYVGSWSEWSRNYLPIAKNI